MPNFSQRIQESSQKFSKEFQIFHLNLAKNRKSLFNHCNLIYFKGKSPALRAATECDHNGTVWIDHKLSSESDFSTEIKAKILHELLTIIESINVILHSDFWGSCKIISIHHTVLKDN